MLGAIHGMLGEFAESENCSRRAVELAPRSIGALLNLGNALMAQGKHKNAERCYRDILKIRPEDAQSHNNLGNLLKTQNKAAEAEASYRAALRYAPNYPDAHANLGMTLQDQGRLEEAMACYRRAIQLKPDHVEAVYNLGSVWITQENPAQAVACYEHLLRLDSVNAKCCGLCGLGIAHQTQGHVDDALACYTRAIELNPNYADAHWNRALAWLLTGNFAQGWPEYEWRWQRRQNPARVFAQPLWDGSPISGKTILLHAEQGFGDMIQFIRYAPLVKRLGATVIVECPPELVRLLQACEGVDRVIAHGEVPPEFDTHAPLLSLPARHKTTIETIPAVVPYLHAPDGVRPAALPDDDPTVTRRIGIVWAGRPGYTAELRNRSCPLSPFLRVAELPNIALYSLQKGPRTDDLKSQEARMIRHFGDQLGDFADTATVIEQLDLVITIDTAVAHLAGALGKPVWVLLPFIPDWRWLLEREDSPWYPTMRLFRQRRHGDWAEVFDRVITALAGLP